MSMALAATLVTALLSLSVAAQAGAISEVQRWHWRSPRVFCGASDEAGTLAAFGSHDADAGFEVVRASSAALVRKMPCAGDAVVAAALAPGSGLLALAQPRHDCVVLLDLTTGRERSLDIRARSLTWTPNGRAVVCVGGDVFASFDRDGKRLAEGTASPFASFEANDAFAPVAHDPFHGRLLAGQWNVVALDERTAFACSAWGSYSVMPGSEEPPDLPLTELRLWGSLASDEIVATYGSQLVVYDSRWQVKSERNLTQAIDAASVARATRMVAVVVAGDVVVCEVGRAK